VTILALETSCDETAVAILRDNELLASEVASQIVAHETYGGVVPEVASRAHLQSAPRLIERALSAAGVGPGDIDAFAATSGPGLAGSLMIGASVAKGLAIGLGKPYLAINHLEGHLLSPFFGGLVLPPPHVGLIASGGHTLLLLVRGIGDYEIIGRTVDDAAGEAFDKVAKLLGLSYPGGPNIERLAHTGDPRRFDLPRSMWGSLDFSFSGLKTAVRYLLPNLQTRSDESASEQSGNLALDEQTLSDVCASFQQAVIDVLVEKAMAAAAKHDVQLVTMSGGVSCNRELRGQMTKRISQGGRELKTAEQWLCTDNAAMIAFAALLRFRTGFSSSIEEEIDPNLALA
jgi:N6-L-threonylcarbamoyladenine synthase